MIRITCLLKRRAGMSHAEFCEYWSEHHAPLFTKLQAVKDNLVRYSQFHILEDYSAQFEAMGLTVAQFDGAAEFYVERLEDFGAVLADEDYLKNAVPDELSFLDKSSVQILVGEDKVKHTKSFSV